MGLSQLIYTSSTLEPMTPDMAYAAAARSLSICAQLGLVGRVFANTRDAFAVTEGPTEMAQRYFQAVSEVSLIKSIILHTDTKIETCEFLGYCVWLNIPGGVTCTDTVRELTSQTLPKAFPTKTSVRLKIMIEAYLKNGLLTD